MKKIINVNNCNNNKNMFSFGKKKNFFYLILRKLGPSFKKPA